jgi:hypothetical protein
MKFVIATQFGYFKKVFFKKNQVAIFKNKLRTPIFSFGGSFAPQAQRREVPK